MHNTNVNYIIPAIALTALIFVILISVLVIKISIKKAIRKFIIPQLEEKGLIYLSYDWAGLFSTGDFEPEFTLITIRGNPSQSIYIYVNYLNKGDQKRVTARIDTLFMFIRKVVYSHELRES